MSVLPKYVYNAGSGDVEIEFTAELAADPHETIKSKRKLLYGGTGVMQVNFMYNEKIIVLEHEFITRAEVDAVQTMIETWVIRGNTFDFYPDKDVASYTTLELIDNNYKPKRMHRNALDLWAFKLKCREVIT